MRKYFVLSIGLLALWSCAAPKQTQPANTQATEISFAEITFKDSQATRAERELCEAIGGSVSQQGFAGYEMCVRPYADAGTICTDSADCLGQCRVQDISSNNSQAPATGLCQADNVPFGCYAEVRQGQVGHALCVD